MYKLSKIELVTDHLTSTIENYITSKMSCNGAYPHHAEKQEGDYKVEIFIDPPSDVLMTFRDIAHEIKTYLDQANYQGKFEFKFIK
jgi:hypothetical protein